MVGGQKLVKRSHCILSLGWGVEKLPDHTDMHTDRYVFMTWLTILAGKQFSFAQLCSAIKMGSKSIIESSNCNWA